MRSLVQLAMKATAPRAVSPATHAQRAILEDLRRVSRTVVMDLRESRSPLYGESRIRQLVLKANNARRVGRCHLCPDTHPVPRVA